MDLNHSLLKLATELRREPPAASGTALKVVYTGPNEIGAQITVTIEGDIETNINYGALDKMTYDDMVLDEHTKLGLHPWIYAKVLPLFAHIDTVLGLKRGVNCTRVVFQGKGLAGTLVAILGVYYSVKYKPTCRVNIVTLNAPRFTNAHGRHWIIPDPGPDLRGCG